MRFVNLLIERSEHLAIPVQVPVWEMPILQFIHSPEKVSVGSEVELEREIPGEVAEYERLETCYGSDIKTERAFVAEIYGQPPRGFKALKQAIEASLLPAQIDEDDPTL